MAVELDPPIDPVVMKAVRTFAILVAVWLVGSLSVHTALWYKWLPDLRASPRACGPAPGGPTLEAEKRAREAAAVVPATAH